MTVTGLAQWILSIPNGAYEVRRGGVTRRLELRSDQAKLELVTELRDFLSRSRIIPTLEGTFTRVED